MSARWPDLEPGAIVYEDDALVAIDKPAGVSTQAADPQRPDDLPHRLACLLRTRDAAREPYVGVHQRLDQDTSGVILYALDPRANASLAAQMEARQVEKTYSALVEGRVCEGALEHWLAPGPNGRAVVSHRGDGRAKRALTHIRATRRVGSRTLLELRIETGRTHQIRAQLAHVGAPIVGDARYGGAAGPRLMLHARRLTLRHPLTDAPLSLEAPLPSALKRALNEPASPDFGATLAAAMQRRWALSREPDTDVFRLVNEEGDQAPGFALDRYGDWLVLHLYASELERPELLDAVHALGFSGVYLKRRPRQANTIVDGRDDSLAPSEPVRGEAAEPTLVVREGGVPFRVRLGEGLSTGLFLDQRDNRARVRQLAAGKRVLNLFSYTCGFSVAAAAGGATETVSVDASKRLLAWGRENIEAIDTSGEHRFIADDCFAVLDRLARRGERFDVICLDPPTYSRTKKTRWKSGAGWVELSAKALNVLAPGGALLVSSNDRRMSVKAFERHVRGGAKAAGAALAGLERGPAGRDFRRAPGAEPNMKSLWLTRE